MIIKIVPVIPVVPDANILISGMLGRPGYPRKIISLARSKEIVLYGSNETRNEFCKVVRLPRLQGYWTRQIFTPEKMILEYQSLINLIEPFDELRGINIVKSDPDDDKYFRVAKACGAKIVITGDKGVLEVKKYDGIVAVTASQFIESFARSRNRKLS